MRLGLASDHRGYKLKELLKVYLQEKGYEIKDYGSNNFDRVDYTDFAQTLSNGIKDTEIDYGIAICGTGIGMSIACNKQKGIYCAKINNVKEAKLAKEHNDANVIAISGNTYLFKAKRMIIKFLKTEFNSEDETYQKRINDIKELEEVE